MKNKALIIFAIALLVIICIIGGFLFTTGKQENTNEKEDTEQQIVDSTSEFEEISTEQSSETQMETITEDTEGTQIIESAEETESESQEITEQAPAPQEDTSVDIETSLGNKKGPFEVDEDQCGDLDDIEHIEDGEGASGNDSDFRFNSNSADTTETEDNNDSGNSQEEKKDNPFEWDQDDELPSDGDFYGGGGASGNDSDFRF